MAHAEAILPLACLRERATTDLVLSGLEASGVACALFSPDDELSYGSAAFRALFDVQPGARTFADIMRRCHAKSVGPKMSGPIDAFLDMASAKRRSTPQRTFEIDIRDDRWFLVNETLLAGGWLWSVFTDITMLKSNEHMLQLARDAAQLAADTDPLTGLFNRRAAMARLDAEMRIAFRDCTQLSLALIDLDHFKTINDRFGHARGDEVLRHFAAAGRRQLRGGDTFARVGGEEFLMLMPGAGLREATRAVERLRRHVAQEKNRIGLGCAYTMSAGVAEYCGNAAEDLFERADRALYRAKHLGRDRIEQAD
ncbi:diguanylate cyclase [Shinella yambaruensis]|uniref:sensor domain-containing diguanylate cyclase n=1 Tax=Shinella TaxID=323620 RepID=UPI0025893850|nr:sensor domain-containing diguanylate cyclase [Shinella sp.]MCW5709797.1 diguanylate cyclase [Shinella sp.]